MNILDIKKVFAELYFQPVKSDTPVDVYKDLHNTMQGEQGVTIYKKICSYYKIDELDFFIRFVKYQVKQGGFNSSLDSMLPLEMLDSARQVMINAIINDMYFEILQYTQNKKPLSNYTKNYDLELYNFLR